MAKINGPKYRETEQKIGRPLDKYLTYLTKEGLTGKEIAKHLEVPYDTVYHWLTRLNINRNNSESNKIAWAKNRWNREEKSKIAYKTNFNKNRLNQPSPRKGKKLPKEHRDNISKGMTGLRVLENHPLWRGGNGLKYGSGWKRAKRLVRERANHRCEICDISEEKLKHNWQLDIHHIIPFRCFNDHREANKLENLLAVCRKCHNKIDNKPNCP